MPRASYKSSNRLFWCMPLSFDSSMRRGTTWFSSTPLGTMRSVVSPLNSVNGLIPMTASHFPARHLKVVRQVWRYSAIAFAVTGLPAMVLTYMAMSKDTLTFPAAIADAVFIFCTWGSFCSVVDVHRHACIIPYFQSAVGEIDTFGKKNRNGILN